VLQCGTVWCSVLQCVADIEPAYFLVGKTGKHSQKTQGCGVVQYVAVCCSVLQSVSDCVAVCCTYLARIFFVAKGWCGVATNSRLLKIIGLFCRISSFY